MPNRWPTAKLEDVCVRITDGTHQSPRFESKGIPFLVISDVVSGQIEWSGVSKWVDEATYEANTARCKPERGDVLYTAVGSFGVAVPVETDQRFMFQRHIAHIKPDLRRMDTGFLAHLLNSPEFKALADRVAKGAAQRTVTLADLKNFEVLAPPLPEQRRIAAILDKADAIRRKRQEAITLTDELLRSAFLEMFGDPVSNPKGWPSAPLGTLARFIGGGTPSRQNASYFTGDLCWATPKDMRGEVLTDTEEHITELALRGSAAKVVPPDTLLVVVKSKVLAHRLPVARTTVRTCFGQDLKGICLNAPPLVRYVHRHLLFGQSALLERARGLNTEGLTLEHLREYEVMLPPDRLVSKFTEIERRLEGLLHRERNCLSEATSLCDSLTHRAFSGEL